MSLGLARRPPQHLDAVAALVAPEERHRRVRLALAAGGFGQQVGGDRRPLLGRVRPVLDAQLLVEVGVGPAGDVAGGVDARHRGAQRGVADDAVAERQRAALEPAGDRRHADADDDHVGRDDGAVAERHAVGAHVGDGDVAAQVDPLFDVDPGGGHAELGAEAAHERGRQAFEHRHRTPERARRRRDLETDEAGADDDDAGRPVGEAVPQARARRRACAARGPRPAAPATASGSTRWRRPGRRRAGVLPSASATVRASVSSPIAGTPRRRSRREGVERLRLAEDDPVGFPVAGEQLLGQRRAVVGQVRLGPDERDGAAEPVRTQGLARPETGQRGADDDDAVEPIGEW